MSEQVKKIAVEISFSQYFVGTAEKPPLDNVEKFCKDNNIDFYENNINSFTNSLIYNMYDYYFYLVLYHDESIKTGYYEIYKFKNTDNLTNNLNVNDITKEEKLLMYLPKNVSIYTNVIPVVLKYNMNELKPEQVVVPFIEKIEIKNKINGLLLDSKTHFRLDRKYFTSGFTLGELFKDNKHYCYTVEDRVRFSTEACKRFNPKKNIIQGSELCKVKITGITAIPCGTYKVQNIYSEKFKCNGQPYVPKLLTVYDLQPPCFTQIAMHSGGSASWSEGCIIISSTITDKENGKVKNDGQDLMNDIFNIIKSGYGLIDITQKVNGIDLNDEHIKKITEGDKLGKI